jgi:hypothetical protein
LSTLAAETPVVGETICSPRLKDDCEDFGQTIAAFGSVDAEAGEMLGKRSTAGAKLDSADHVEGGNLLGETHRMPQ